MKKRELIYKVWDMRDGVFLEDIIDLYHIKDDNWNNNTSDYIFLQSTGLFDKNSKEIYEGDILETEYTGSASRRVIKYNISSDFSGFGYIGNLNTSKVIGNIYENPELIK